VRVFRARVVVEGECIGEPFIVDKKVSFYGEVDPRECRVYGYSGSFRDKVLVIRGSRGSTVGSYIVYGLRRYGCSVHCIISGSIDPVLVAGCVIAGIPLYIISDYNGFIEYIRSLNKPVVKCSGLGEVVVYEEGSTNSY